MSRRESNGFSKRCQVTKINGATIWLYRGFDLTHGRGWFSHAFKLSNLKNSKDSTLGFGFHKTNRFTAVREAMKFN